MGDSDVDHFGAASALPADLPRPVDDGAAEGLEGRAVPRVRLVGSDGRLVDLAEAANGTLVLYVYARTGVPGESIPPEWDAIPGARGCTPESCAFRDLAGEFASFGAILYGVGAQAAEEQRAFAERHRLPFPLLNDGELALADVLGLPTFEFGGRRFYRRLTLVARSGRIEKVFYPVFPPDTHADEVLGWLRLRGETEQRAQS